MRKIYVTGYDGFVGKNLISSLEKNKDVKILVSNFDLKDTEKVDKYFYANSPDAVINLAAKVGGIAANIADPYHFLLDNLIIQNNIINSSVKHGVKKVIMLGSSCVFPKDYPSQPLKEEYLMDGKLEPTNEAYALAKICGLKLAEYANKQFDTKFICLMPANLYGPGDHYNLETSHALAALVMKAMKAIKNNEKELVVWGSGNQRREWLFVYDLIDCILWALDNVESTDTFLNVGTGVDISMNDLARYILDVIRKQNMFGTSVYFEIEAALDNLKIVNDISKPDGMMKKCLDVSKINNMGWVAKWPLYKGLGVTISDFLIKNK